MSTIMKNINKALLEKLLKEAEAAEADENIEAVPVNRKALTYQYPIQIAEISPPYEPVTFSPQVKPKSSL